MSIADITEERLGGPREPERTPPHDIDSVTGAEQAEDYVPLEDAAPIPVSRQTCGLRSWESTRCALASDLTPVEK